MWETLSRKHREKLLGYYRCVLMRGHGKVKDKRLEKHWKKLLKWMVKKDYTIHFIPKEIYQKIQIEIFDSCLDTIL